MATKKSGTGGQHRFSTIPSPTVQRSTFDRSCGLKTTFDAGGLIPIFVDEALPGDTFSMKTTLFGRIATLLHPIMDNVYLDTFYFAVPMRLVWDNWEKFMGQQDNPGDSIDFTIPIITAPIGGYAEDSIYDYMGLPVKVDPFTHSALPLRAYHLIYNEWFRDQNLQDSKTISKGDGPDGPGIYELVKRGKRHDYFTSCLPWPQKGDPVSLPLGQNVPVISTGDGFPTFDMGTSLGHSLHGETSGDIATWNLSGPSDTGDAKWNDPKLEADLSSATAATINQLRQAFQIQKLLERDARGGTRYSEIVRSHFGVVSPDQRLQRPEYLGGGSTPLFTREVANTAGLAEAQAVLAAYGTIESTGQSWRKSFTEHTIIIGLVSLRADLNYQQGLERMWSRQTKYDFYWPALAHLGEQAVLNKEIMTQGDSADDDVFGYQERFAEYRYKPSRISGTFRSSAGQSLDTWHLAQDFGVLPTLSDDFIQEDPPIDRVIGILEEAHMLLDCFFEFRCARPMPVYSVPGLIDHF